MTVRADDAIPCADKSLLGQKRMLDAHRTHVEEVFHALAHGKCPRTLDLTCGFDVLVGRKMIHDKRDLVFILDVPAHFFQLFDRDGRSDVVGEREIELCFDELSRSDGRESRMCCENLLRHRHSHILLSFFWISLDKVYHI